MSAEIAGLGALIGFLGAVGFLLLINGLRRLPVSVFAVLDYTALIWAGLLGFIFFAEVPDVWTLAGAAVVIASGLYTFYREAKRHVPPVAQESAPRSPV